MHEKRKLNRWKEPPWTARRASEARRSAGSVGAWVSVDALAGQGAGCFPKTTCGHGRGRSCRSTQPTAPGTEREQGGGGGAAQERAGYRPRPCGLARAAGRGRMRVGNERHAFANARNLIPAASGDSHGGSLLATLENLYLRPASNAGRFIGRCSSASLHLAAGPLRGHRPVEAPSALHHLFAAHLSILGAPPAHLGCRVLKSRPGVSVFEYPGKLRTIKNLWHQRGPANYRGETQADPNTGSRRQ